MRPINLIYQQPSFYALVHRKKQQHDKSQNDLHGYKVSSCIAYKDHNSQLHLAEIYENKFHIYSADDMTNYKIVDFIEYITCDGQKYKAAVKNMSFIITKLADPHCQDACTSMPHVGDSIIYANWYDKTDIISSFAQWGNME